MTAARFLVRSLSLRGSPFLLALLAVTVGASVAATMLNLRSDLRTKMSRELRRYGPNLLVKPQRSAIGSAESAMLDETSVLEVRSVIGSAGTVDGRGPSRRGEMAGAALCPMLIATGMVEPTLAPAPSFPDRNAQSTSTGTVAATIIGADFDALRRIYPTWRLKGNWPEPGKSSCLVGASLSASAGLAPGDRVVLRVARTDATHPPIDPDPRARGGTTMMVAGIVATGEAEDDEVIVPLVALQEMLGTKKPAVSLVAIALDGGSDVVARAAEAIEAAVPGTEAEPLWQIARAQGAILDKLERMMLLLTIAVLALSGLCLVTTLMTIVVEREREIGLMRSMGAGDGEMLWMLLAEIGLLGLAGGAAGLLFGALGARLIGSRLFGSPIDPPAHVIPVVLAISITLCAISALVPLRRALSIQPAAALRGD